MKKWQLGLTVVLLLSVMAGMSYISDVQRQKAEAKAKAIQEAKEQAEAKAKAGTVTPPKGTGAKPLFTLPAPLGPPAAPIKVVAYVDCTNSCHQNILDLRQLAPVYGKLLRVEWSDMSKPQVKDQADKLSMGCESGLAINGKVEAMAQSPLGKKLLAFRGPLNDKYTLADLHSAINYLLVEKGKPVPAAAKQAAAGAGKGAKH